MRKWATHLSDVLGLLLPAGTRTHVAARLRD